MSHISGSSEDEPPGNGIPERLILESGTCSSCHDNEAFSAAVCCFHCIKNFHVLCKDSSGKDLPGNICTKSFLTNFTSRTAQSSRFGNFWFRCNACSTNGQ